ncbi:MAG TPA: ABC transporter permease [Candidatus Limnocylindrales bacterium]|nr:ABC transporter permease [Candidatus Limnocylindrales bacterium]
MNQGGTNPSITAKAYIDNVLGSSAPDAKAARRGSLVARLVWWIVFLLGVVYFLGPLFMTLLFSLRSKPLPTAPTDWFNQNLSAYANLLADPQFGKTLVYSFVIGIITVVVSIALIVPTAFWVRLRLPQLRRLVEFITLLPFVIPPIVLVFGLIRGFKGPPLPLTNSDLGSNVLLVAGYTVLSLPYMYRAVDVGLRSIDVRSLTEASQSLGAGWFLTLWRVILPNLRVSLLSGAFLTLAIVIGEYTIATFLARPAFGPYLALIGQNKAYEPAAASLISFGLTWIAMGVIALLGRGSRVRVQVAGAH